MSIPWQNAVPRIPPHSPPPPRPSQRSSILRCRCPRALPIPTSQRPTRSCALWDCSVQWGAEQGVGQHGEKGVRSLSPQWVHDTGGGGISVPIGGGLSAPRDGMRSTWRVVTNRRALRGAGGRLHPFLGLHTGRERRSNRQLRRAERNPRGSREEHPEPSLPQTAPRGENERRTPLTTHSSGPDRPSHGPSAAGRVTLSPPPTHTQPPHAGTPARAAPRMEVPHEDRPCGSSDRDGGEGEPTGKTRGAARGLPHRSFCSRHRRGEGGKGEGGLEEGGPRDSIPKPTAIPPPLPPQRRREEPTLRTHRPGGGGRGGGGWGGEIPPRN